MKTESHPIPESAVRAAEKIMQEVATPALCASGPTRSAIVRHAEIIARECRLKELEEVAARCKELMQAEPAIGNALFGRVERLLKALRAIEGRE